MKAFKGFVSILLVAGLSISALSSLASATPVAQINEGQKSGERCSDNKTLRGNFQLFGANCLRAIEMVVRYTRALSGELAITEFQRS